LNNTISASLINYQFLNQDYKENASDSKINEDNAFIRKIENQLKDIVDWLLGNFQITENNSSERKCSSKLTELLSEISTNMSSGSIYSIDQLKNLFKTAYNFLLKNKELTNIMVNFHFENIDKKKLILRLDFI